MKRLKILSLIGTLVFSMSLIGATTYAQTTPTTNTVNVQSYGATGNDKTDDTSQIQNAIDSASKSGQVVDIPKGDYYINPNVGLFMKDNTTLNFEEGARLVSLPTSNSWYGIVKAFGVSNVKITGSPTIIGDRDVHTGTGGEWGMGIIIDSSNSVYIENANISNCWGDGIYIGVLDGQSQQYSKDVTLKNINLDNNRRQGISVISAINLEIDNPKITNTNGTAPSAGIDFEPNYGYQYLQNITVTNPYIQGNDGHGIQFSIGLGPFDTPVGINIINDSNVKNNEKHNYYGSSASEYNLWITGKEKGQIMIDGKNYWLVGSPTITNPIPAPVTSDLQKQVDDLKAQNTTLQNQVKSLTDENNKLSTKLKNIQSILNQ